LINVYKYIKIYIHTLIPKFNHQKGERIMKVNAPTERFWWISVILGVIGILGYFVAIPFVTVNAFWFVTVGFVVLVLSTVLKGM